MAARVRLALMVAAVATLVGETPAPARQGTVQKSYTIVVDDDLVILRRQPPPVFDDKGKLRKPTAAELRKMKDPKSKEYKADYDDLKPGQVVTVTLAQAKTAAAKTRGGKAGDNDRAGAKKPAYTVVAESTGKLVRAPVPRVKAEEGKGNAEAKATMVVGFDSLRLPGQAAPAPRDKTRLPPTVFVVRIVIVAEPTGR